MATKVIMPLLGQTMEEGTITKWLKQEGDSIEKGEPLLEVMTDKANMEVESPASGIVRKILAAEESAVPVQEMIAIIGSADEPIDDLLSSVGGTAIPIAETPMKPTEPAKETVSKVQPEPVIPEGHIFASPRAKSRHLIRFLPQ